MGSDSAPRWRRRKDARPQEITAAALEVFAERGFAAARLEDVAARAGVSKGTLYLYFPNKEELFKAVVREAVIPNIERVERLLDGFPGPTMAILEQLLTGIARGVIATRAVAIPKLVIAEAGNFPELARFYLDEVVHRGFGVLARVIRRGIERGEFRPVPVEHTVRIVFGPVLLSAIWKSAFEPLEGRPLDVDGLMAAHLEGLRRALAPDPADPAGGAP